MNKVKELRELIASGRFHHATYRNFGTVWEGLWIYIRDPKGFRGYSVYGCFNKDQCSKEEMDEAHEIVRGTGISVGSFGNG